MLWLMSIHHNALACMSIHLILVYIKKYKVYISSHVASTAALICFWSMEYLQRWDLKATLLIPLTSGHPAPRESGGCFLAADFPLIHPLPSLPIVFVHWAFPTSCPALGITPNTAELHGPSSLCLFRASPSKPSQGERQPQSSGFLKAQLRGGAAPAIYRDGESHVLSCVPHTEPGLLAESGSLG